MPRPSWLLITNSLLFMAASLFVGGVSLAGFFSWDPCIWISATLIGLPACLLAYWQYKAAFRADVAAAKALFSCLMILGALLGYGTFAGLCEAVATRTTRSIFWLLLGISPIVLVSSWFLFTGILARRWQKQLSAGGALAERGATLAAAASLTGSRPSPWQLPRMTLRELLGLIAAASIFLAGFSLAMRDSPPQRQLHVSSAEARLNLPAGAYDVCVLRGSRGIRTYDFAIDEVGFLEWANSGLGSIESEAANIPLKRINGSFTISAFTRQPDSWTEPHTIRRGWYYSWQKEDRAVKYAYDADTGRAYYDAHFH